MNTWLVGFAVEISGVEMMVHHMISATDMAQAESGAIQMGRTWWDSLLREDDHHRWQYPDGVVWFNSIILLDDVENSILRGLKFLDTWVITEAPDAPVVADEYGNDWRDVTR